MKTTEHERLEKLAHWWKEKAEDIEDDAKVLAGHGVDDAALGIQVTAKQLADSIDAALAETKKGGAVRTTREERDILRIKRTSNPWPIMRRSDTKAICDVWDAALDLLDDIDEAEARAERYEAAIKTTLRKFPTWALDDLRDALAETTQKTWEAEREVDEDGVRVYPQEPGASSPDDAERAAREWWAEHVNGVSADFDEHPETSQALVRLPPTQLADPGALAGYVEALEGVATCCANAWPLPGDWRERLDEARRKAGR